MMAAVMPGKEDASVAPAGIYTTKEECEIAGEMLPQAVAKDDVHAEPGCILLNAHPNIAVPQ